MPDHPHRAASATVSSRASILAALLLGAAAGQACAAAPVRFDPKAFFSGRTEGIGRLKVIFRSGVDMRVAGTGRVESDGTLNLTQVVRQGDKPPRTRVWRIREIAPGRYTGTLSDAKGPVTGEVVGDRLHIAFTSLEGYGYEQWITVAPDGRSAHNLLKVSRLGFNVAQIDETIRKLD